LYSIIHLKKEEKGTAGMSQRPCYYYYPHPRAHDGT